MKGVIQRLFGCTPDHAEGEPGPMPTRPAAGQVYSFRTRPYWESAHPATNRYAALKVLGADDKCVAVAVLDGIWPSAPTINELQTASIINEHRFAHTGTPAIFGVPSKWWTPETDLDQFSFVGMQAVSSTQRSIAGAIAASAPGSRFSSLHAADYAAEGEWRWSNDREAFVSEKDKENVKEEAERAAKEQRYRHRVSKLTWDQLLSETPFTRWSPSPPFPPESFTAAARHTIRDACEALKELGPKPRKKDVRAILKQTVLWFNEADEEAGGVIETEEREDICSVLEEMAYVARHKSLVDEIDEWRDW